VQTLLADHGDRLTVAAHNGPTTTVVSGDPAALEELRASVERQGAFFQLVKVDYASHSAQMDPLRDELLDALAGIAAGPTSIPMLSTVTADLVSGPECDSHYWIRNIRDPVLFAQAIESLARGGHDIFVEVSPHPILTGAIAECLRHAARDGAALSSLRRGEDGRGSILGSLGSLYALGYPVDWSRLHGSRGRVVPLPSYPWQREHFWLDKRVMTDGAQGGPTGKGLLGRSLASSVQVGMYFWERDLSVSGVPYLGDHRVQELAVLPAAAYLEMALAATAEVLGDGPHLLEKVTFEKALFLPENEPKTVQLAMAAQMGGATFQFLSRDTSSAGAAATWTRHAAGAVRVLDPAAQAPVTEHEPIGAIQARCQETLSGPDLYRAVQERGLHYGPSFQGLERLWRREGEALGRLRASVEVESSAKAYRIHPALLDACFHVVAAALPKSIVGDDQLYLPVSVASMRLHAQPGLTLWSHAIVHPVPAEKPDTIEADVVAFDDAGQVVVEVRGLGLQRVEQQRSELRDWLYEVRWTTKALTDQARALDPLPPEQRGRWLVFADAHGAAESLRGLLEARGEHCVLLSRTANAREFLAEAFGPDQPAWRGIVHMWSLDTAAVDETTAATLADAREAGCVSALHLVQALAGADRGDAPRLWLVTQGAQAVGVPVDSVSIAQAPLWGLGKTIAVEHPELHCTRIDLGPAGGPEEIRALFHELWLNDGEDEVALRGGERYVPRLVRRSPEPTAPQPVVVSGDQPFRLEVPTVGVLDNFVLRSTRRRSPGAGEVEIRVAASGLNFRDVLTALGLVPPAFDNRLEFGFECAGTIVTVGEGVERFRVGDEVIAGARATLASYAIAPEALVVPKPHHLSFEAAATIPIAYMTAYYALHHMGRLRAGERVLIHAAAGGVGLAAVQIAQRIGAEIFATAGSPEKREFLHSLGIRHVMDSRSLAFAGQVRELTDDRGVDVVLNSLAGDFIPASLSTLAPGGRFLEIGKVDVLKNTPLGMGLLEKNVAFFVIDLAQLFKTRLDFCRSVLEEATGFLQEETFKPLPFQVFPVSQAVDAFRHLAQAKHIGKVILSLQEPEVSVMPAPHDEVLVRADGTYLITGGFGGLGLAVARWLAEQGARHLVLMGRSGPSSGEAKEALETLQRAGVEVAVAHGDVAREADVARVLNGVRAHLPPLRGVVHAAGVLDDGILLQQDSERFARVMAPKIDGAWALHTLTADDPLDFFVLFSSGASVLGSPGQGNYVAANAFLDALAHHRRARGLPGLSINWGAWAEVGLATRADRVKHLTAQGILPFTPAQGTRMLADLLRQNAPQLTALQIDWSKLLAVYSPPLLSELAQEVAARIGAAAPSRDGLTREHLEAAAPGARHELLQEFLVNQIARVLRCSPAKVDVHQPLTRLGIDSLMAVELKNRIEANLTIKLPVVALLKGPSLATLAAELLKQVGMAATGESAPPIVRQETAAELLSRVDQLSEAEVDTLLRSADDARPEERR
jgi:acyl transferase domain-containing protein/acyl carrier protein